MGGGIMGVGLKEGVELNSIASVDSNWRGVAASGKTTIATFRQESRLTLTSSTRQRWVAAALAAALCNASVTLPAVAQTPAPSTSIHLPSLGDTASDEFGVSPERQLGEQIMREIRRDPDYLDDPLLLAYVQSLWTPLVRQARAQGELGAEIDERFSFELFLVRDRSVNAFALPGGYVGVHTGLIGLTSSSDELAAVLAHELTHVTQRHIARGIANSKKQSMIALASMIVGVLAASRNGGGAAANAAIVGGQAVAVQGQLNFSRDMEREADRIGFSVLGGAGFAPAGMAAMFEKLALSSRLNDSGAFPYLRSHPLTSERLGEARSRLSGAAPTTLATWEHSVAQAHARVLGDGRVEVLRRWQSQQSETCEPSAPSKNLDANQDIWLGCVQSALASKALRDWRRFDAALAQAEKRMPTTGAQTAAAQQWFDLLRAQSLVQRGDAVQAASVLTRAQDNRNALGQALSHLDRPLLLQRAEVAAAPGMPRAAVQSQIDALQTWLSSHAHDVLAWRALSALWTAQGQRLRAVRADAESHHAKGDLTGAMDRLRAGQTLVRSGQVQDFIESSVIDARLRDLEALQKRLLLEQKGL
jgi:beta-barrel assembly-enhancing protease